MTTALDTGKHMAAEQATDELLDDPEDFHRRRVLVYYGMALLDRGLSRLGRTAPQTVCRSVSYIRLLTCSLFLATATLVPLFIFRYNSPSTIWLHLYLGLALFVQLWSVEYINRIVLRTLLPTDGKQYKSRQFWESLSIRHRYQILPGALSAVAAVLLAPLLFQEVFNEPPGIPLYIAFAAQGFILGAGSCGFIVGATHFVQNISAQHFQLYAFDPRKSPVIDRISGIFEATLSVFSLNLVVLLLPLAFVPRTPLLLLTALVVSVIGFGQLIAIFVLAQQRLTALVWARKYQTLTALQQRIEEFYHTTEKLDKTAFEDLQNLMKLHDQVANANAWGVSTTRLANYGRAFVLPAITAVYANREIAVAVYEWLRGGLVP